jgi:hypothetical protein
LTREVTDPPSGSKIIQRVERVSDTVRTDRISALTLRPGAKPVPLIVQQWLMQTSHGGIAFAFATSHEGMASATANHSARRSEVHLTSAWSS